LGYTGNGVTRTFRNRCWNETTNRNHILLLIVWFKLTNSVKLKDRRTIKSHGTDKRQAGFGTQFWSPDQPTHGSCEAAEDVKSFFSVSCEWCCRVKLGWPECFRNTGTPTLCSSLSLSLHPLLCPFYLWAPAMVHLVSIHPDFCLNHSVVPRKQHDGGLQLTMQLCCSHLRPQWKSRSSRKVIVHITGKRFCMAPVPDPKLSKALSLQGLELFSKISQISIAKKYSPWLSIKIKKYTFS